MKLGSKNTQQKLFTEEGIVPQLKIELKLNMILKSCCMKIICLFVIFSILNGTGRELFDYLADCIAILINKENITSATSIPLGMLYLISSYLVLIKERATANINI